MRSPFYATAWVGTFPLGNCAQERAAKFHDRLRFATQLAAITWNRHFLRPLYRARPIP